MRGELSSWQQEKLGVLFDLLDNDGDGRLEENELQSMLDRLWVDTGWPESSRVVRHVQSRWRSLLDTLFSERSGLTRGNWLAALSRALSSDCQRRLAQESYRGPVEEFAQLLFMLLDRDRNGEIDPEEFLLFFYTIGRRDEEAEQSFRQLDLDGDGVLSKREVEDLALEFFHSCEPGSSGDWLFGPPQKVGL